MKGRGAPPLNYLGRYRGIAVFKAASHGRIIVQSWPPKQSPAHKAANAATINAFRNTQASLKYIDGSQQAAAIDLAKQTGWYPRDLIQRAMAGGLVVAYMQDGSVLWGRQDLAQNLQAQLDQLSSIPGSILMRGPNGWVGILPGAPGQVLTAHGPATILTWEDQAASFPDEPAGAFFAGPVSGPDAQPAFRAITTSDIPALAYAPKTTGTDILMGDGLGGFNAVTVGAGLQLIGNDLSYVGGVLPPAPVRRGSNAVGASANSYTLNLPSGTVAGDQCLILWGHGFGANLPSGFTDIDRQIGTQWNGGVMGKTLTSTDITTGHIIVTTTGSFDGVMMIVTYIGPTGGIAALVSERSGLAASSVTLGAQAPGNGGDVLYFASNRANTLPTINRGTSIQAPTPTTNGAGQLYAGAPPFYGTGCLCTLPSNPTGNYCCYVIINGL